MTARCLALSLFAAAASALQGQGLFTETMEVRVTTVDAIVTTRDGKAVTGLTQDQFEIYEDGVRQEISNFAEIAEAVHGVTSASGAPAALPPTTPAASSRRRHVTVFVDDATLHFGNRNSVLAHLRDFLKSNVGAGDTAAIFHWSSSLRAELEPTGDHARIDAAIDRLEKNAPPPDGNYREQLEQELATLISSYKSRQPPEVPPIELALNAASFFGMRGTAAMQQKGEALKSVISAQRGLDARKILVFLTQSLTTNAAEEAYLYVESVADQFVGGAPSAVVEARPFELTNLPLEIAAAANSAGVTLYPINAAGRMTDGAGNEAHRTVRIGNQGGAHISYKSTPALLRVAADTGGFAVAGSANWKGAFDRIAADLHTYYSLGYRNRGERQDRVKKVEVRLKDKRYLVRTRNSVVEQTASTEMSDAVAANLFRPAEKNEIGVRATLDRAVLGEDKLFVTVTIPTSSLTLVPEGADLAGNFSVFAAFLRQDGAVSRVAQQSHRFRFPAESLPRRKELTVKLEVSAEITTNAMSVGVLDEIARTSGFATVSLIR